jgi:hypothetical protein
MNSFTLWLTEIGSAAWHLLPQAAGCASNVSEMQPRTGNNKELWGE